MLIKKFILPFFIFFTPLVQLIISNLNYYNLSYFNNLSIFFFVLFFLLVILCLLISSLVNEINFYKLIIVLSFFFYIQFYFNDIVIYFDLLNNNNYLLKFIIIIFFIIISFIFYFSFNKKIGLFLYYFLFLNILFTLVDKVNLVNLKDKIFYKNNVNLQYYKASHDSVGFENHNVYFFVFDGLPVLDDIINKYNNIAATEIIEGFKAADFMYLEDSLTGYERSKDILASFFRQSYAPVNKTIYPTETFPTILEKNEFNLSLIKNLRRLDYSFYLIYGRPGSCTKYKYIECISYRSFLSLLVRDKAIGTMIDKSIFRSIFYRIYFQVVSKLPNEPLWSETDELIKFVKLNPSVIKKKKNFFFIAESITKAPYRDKNCNIIDDYEDSIAVEAFVDTVSCALKKMISVKDYVLKIDKNAIIIFLGDGDRHVTPDKRPLNKYRMFSLLKVPQRCKNNIVSDFNNIDVINFTISCIGNSEFKKTKTQLFDIENKYKDFNHGYKFQLIDN